MDTSIVVLHGYTPTPVHPWIPWLSERLRGEGLETLIPQLPLVLVRYAFNAPALANA